MEDYLLNVGYPTAVELRWFEVTDANNKAVTLGWETVSEIDNLGFNLYRAETIDGERIKVNAELIPSLVNPGSPSGAVYEYTDTAVRQGEALDKDMATEESGRDKTRPGPRTRPRPRARVGGSSTTG